MSPQKPVVDLSLKFKKSMNLKYINIVDPCFSKNNLGKSISLFNSYRLKEAFKMQSEKLKKISQKVDKIISKNSELNSAKTQLHSYLMG